MMLEKVAQCCDCLSVVNRSKLLERVERNSNGFAYWNCPACGREYQLPGNGENWTQREREEDDVYVKL